MSTLSDAFRVILVIDILGGVAVHATHAEREKYLPVHMSSNITNTSDPYELVLNIRPKEAYIADLDRIMGRGDNQECIRKISEICTTMLDPGCRSIQDVQDAHEISENVILGTETASLELIEQSSGTEISVSIDLKNNRVLSEKPELQIPALELIELLNQYDLRDVILLDLDRVGTSAGINTSLIAQAVDKSAHNILIGGGIRSTDDLETLQELGVKGALIATVVHSGGVPMGCLDR